LAWNVHWSSQVASEYTPQGPDPANGAAPHPFAFLQRRWLADLSIDLQATRDSESLWILSIFCPRLLPLRSIVGANPYHLVSSAPAEVSSRRD
jgi:hypothetical protein